MNMTLYTACPEKKLYRPKSLSSANKLRHRHEVMFFKNNIMCMIICVKIILLNLPAKINVKRKQIKT